MEFDLRESHNELAPKTPIELTARWRVVRVEFDLRASLNALAPGEPIKLHQDQAL